MECGVESDAPEVAGEALQLQAMSASPSSSSALQPSATALRWQNWLSSVLLVAAACAIYALSPFNRRQLDHYYGTVSVLFSGLQFLLSSALVYGVLLGLYFLLLDREPQASKSLRLMRLLARCAREPRQLLRRGLSADDRLVLFTALLKAFFGPMMVLSLMDFCLGAWRNGSAIVESGILAQDFRTVFDRHGFWFALQLIFFVDVLVFTIGYLVELPRLGNQIRSVETTLVGWLAALACYPPFNLLTAAILGSYKSEFPKFADPTVHLLANGLGLTLMAIYTAASVALGFKASNLTHRGIVARGPYAIVRHPAYVCKNAAWWIGASPFIQQAFQTSTFEGLQALGSMAGWTAIYALRALTEEDHLRRVDGDYEVYARKVRYRFIPGLI